MSSGRPRLVPVLHDGVLCVPCSDCAKPKPVARRDFYCRACRRGYNRRYSGVLRPRVTA